MLQDTPRKQVQFSRSFLTHHQVEHLASYDYTYFVYDTLLFPEKYSVLSNPPTLECCQMFDTDEYNYWILTMVVRELKHLEYVVLMIPGKYPENLNIRSKYLSILKIPFA